MPALPMKIESITSCVKDCLHSLCQHSSKICKKKSFWIHKSPKLLDMETPDLLDFQTTRCQSGCHEVAEILEDMKTETAIHSEEQAGLENFKVEEQLLSSEVLSSATMRTSLDECPSNLARVSSPIVQSNDIDCDSSESPDRDSGSEDDLAKEQMEGNSHDTRKTYCLGHESSHDLDLRFLEESNADARRTNDTESGLDDIIKSNLVQELEWAESNVFLDMNGNCIMLPFPFPEDTVSTSLIQGQGFGEEFLLNTESSWFNMVTHHSKLYNQNLANAGPIDYDELDSVDPLLFIRNFLDLSDLEANSLPALLPKETSRGKSITLVLDLDETLVHSTLEPCTDADFTIQVSLNMEQHTFYVRQRPFLKTFLEKVSEMFEIVLFTASQSFYAEQLLDNLDPDRKFFSRREYRETCVLSDGIFTKDLTVLGVDLAKVAIIDNSPQVFRWQVNNGIPIKSWFDDPSDSELISLIPFLETLVEVDDVRPIIAKRFGGS